jgi:hypothetical protein
MDSSIFFLALLALVAVFDLQCVQSSSHQTTAAFLPLKVVPHRRQDDRHLELQNFIPTTRNSSTMGQNGFKRKDIAAAMGKNRITSMRMSKEPGDGENGSNGILFPPGLVFLCSILLPYNNPYWVGAVFVVALAAFNVYAGKNNMN